MEYAYRYGDPSRLYLNPTNRCTNRCSFCIRNHAAGLGGALLRGGPEPDVAELRAAVDAQGGPAAFQEFIWCGFGEPTFRLDLMVEASDYLRRDGARVRLNTNGHGSLIHGRDILRELANAVDHVSISLNAPTCTRYLDLCRPDPRSLPALAPGANGAGEAARPPADFWDGMIEFLSRAPDFFDQAQASVVGLTLAPAEIEECRALAESKGLRFRVR